MATRTFPARDVVIQRQSAHAPSRASAVVTYSQRWVEGWLRGTPNTVLKSARPLVPPRFISLRLNTSHADSASACVMIDR
jgi:hypothetical protein